MDKTMGLIRLTRRDFLRMGCCAAGAMAFFGAMGARAWAAVISVRDCMRERMLAAYREDKAFSVRCSQDNAQADRAYEVFLGEEGGEKAVSLLHTVRKDRSAAAEALKQGGAYPGKRAREFRYKKYPFEEQR